MRELCTLFFSLSVSGSLLILLLLLGKPLCQKRLSRRWQYYIWLVVLARLLLPFTPEVSPVGTLFQEAEPAPVLSEPAPAPLPQAANPPADDGLPAEPADSAPPAEVLSPAPAAPAFGTALRQNLWVLWLGGAALLLIRRIAAYRRFAALLRAGGTPVEDPALLDRLAELGRQTGVRRPVELLCSPGAPSPLLLGVLRPCIVLPTTALPEEDFCCTVLHELTHCRRGDLLYKWLVQAAVCLHWFNPLVHLMAREIGRACELSCDEAVIRAMDPLQRRAYGDTLLRAAGTAGGCRHSPAFVTLTEHGELLKERLDAIMHFQKRSLRTSLLSALLAAALLAGGTAAGAYAAPVSPAGKGGDAFRYTQECYYEAPYLFELGWNVRENTACIRTELSLPEGGPMTVFLSESCEDSLKDTAVQKALIRLLVRLRQETKDTEFPLTRPLLAGVQYVGNDSPAALAEQAYQTSALPQFGAAFALLEEAAQEAWLERIYGDDEIAFFSLAVNQLPQDSPLIGRLAEKTYGDGDIAFFSVLADHMRQETLKAWIVRAERDVRISFRAMLYNKTGQPQAGEQLKAELDAQRLEEYRAHGITQQGTAYYYQNQLVRTFLDLRPNSSIIHLVRNPKGTVDIRILRDEAGAIRSISPMTQSELTELFGDLEDLDEAGSGASEDAWDSWDDWEDQPEASAAAPTHVISLDRSSLESGSYLWLGTYELSCGDRIRYDVSAQTGSELQIGFAAPGDDAPDTVHCFVSCQRSQGEPLRCSGDFTFRAPQKPGPYRLFLRWTGSGTGTVRGSASLTLAKEAAPAAQATDVRSLTEEELPAAVARAAKQCESRTWYTLHAGGRQYLLLRSFPWSFGYAPARQADGTWQVEIVKFQKKDTGAVLLSLPDSGAVTVLLDGKTITPRTIRV